MITAPDSPTPRREPELPGQTVVVIGGSSGIGLETARRAREELGDALKRRREQLRKTLLIGRVLGPADVAAVAIHIMSNTALTGATYDIDGGQQLLAAAAG